MHSAWLAHTSVQDLPFSPSLRVVVRSMCACVLKAVGTGAAGAARAASLLPPILIFFGALYKCAMPACTADLGHRVPRRSSVVGRGPTSARETLPEFSTELTH